MKNGETFKTGAGDRAACHLLVELQLTVPFWQYERLFREQPFSFLLDSAKTSKHLGQYSFLGGDPDLIFRARRQPQPGAPAKATVEIFNFRDSCGAHLPTPQTTVRVCDPFDELRLLLKERQLEGAPGNASSLPLLAGAIGYFGYEAGHFIEELPDRSRDDLDLPDIYLMFCDAVLIYCHRTGGSYLSIVGRGSTPSEAERSAVARRDELLARIAGLERSRTGDVTELAYDSPTDAVPPPIREHFDQESYGRLVERCREHIFAGDVFEVCLTHRLDAPFAGQGWDLYHELRRVNPAPFSAFLRFPEFEIVSSSPERFLRLGADRIAESRPIKGTRRRGLTPLEDAARWGDLESSAKDRAENLMIVDLVRNDLGRVCKFGTVHVPELAVVEPYATVFQLVSTIRGELDDGRDALDLLRAAFPGGSMTGAPKIEAMKIIDSLEPVKRGVYAGAIGYLDFRGTMDLSIAIRVLVLTGGRCHFSVGGAVVADSSPRAEYQETIDKARALVTALTSAAHAEHVRAGNNRA